MKKICCVCCILPKKAEPTTKSPLAKENLPLLAIYQSINIAPSFKDTEATSLPPANEAYALLCKCVRFAQGVCGTLALYPPLYKCIQYHSTIHKFSFYKLILA